MGIEVLDHLIVNAEAGYTNLKEKGYVLTYGRSLPPSFLCFKKIYKPLNLLKTRGKKTFLL